LLAFIESWFDGVNWNWFLEVSLDYLKGC
jgi:hypothetical protein